MKKNVFLLMGIAVMLAACENDMSDELAVSNDKKAITFTCQGDFTMTTESMTRGAMEADGKAMTDLWVLDYVDGQLVQQVHIYMINLHMEIPMEQDILNHLMMKLHQMLQ